ncbi:uncharacterized protein F4812DRAFT_425380 [Daldinia caldariorum]|uniref:uncharacterized protein n=1 Tax=Daldinia caldariorum TaxID=326644 RepID=UPI0020087583|nr:uncharacterized protein F4812DRAFT_425380 [Daldinia caldariorum]KAI1468991.1 hypothetical protein F4812DRAFT_425380 [Daldinia caldariorum]
MLYFIVLSATITWSIVFGLWLVRYPQLLIRATRWAITIWMLVFGLLGMRAVALGFACVDPADLSHYPHPAAVFWLFLAWYVAVCASVVYDKSLIVALAVLLLVLAWFPELRTLMDFGLVRLGWLNWVYNPLFTLLTEALGARRAYRSR